MQLYRKHLFRLALALGVLALSSAAAGAVIRAMSPERLAGVTPRYVAARCILGLLASLNALRASRRAEVSGGALLAALGLLAGAVVCTVLFGQNVIDSLADVMSLLMLIILYTLYRTRHAEQRWQRIRGRKPVVLDLRVPSAAGLFNPIVLGPHLELNTALAAAVDRFLSTSGTAAPLTVCIHTAEAVSLPLQETMREVFQSHYEDEERRIGHYLTSRFSRGIVLVLLSVGALTVWERYMRQYSSSTLWQVLGNFAAFSLWQIGTTYFERSEALRDLMQMLIAKNAEIRFM